MIKNYLITAFRTLRRNKLFAMINVLGLSVGISAALIIYLIVQYDFSFEQFRKDKDSIYRVVTSMSFSGSSIHNGGVPYPVIAATQKAVRGIDGSASFFTSNAKASIPRQDAVPQDFKNRPQLAYVDEHYFNLFPSGWIAGSPAGLKEPFRVALSEGTARIYFPDVKPARVIGRTVIYDDSLTCTVTGILLQPLTAIHFVSPYDNFSGRMASKPALYSLLLVAVFLLTLGSINFINLTTAQAAIYATNLRTKEIGVRKVLGASVTQIVSLLSKDFVKLVCIAYVVAVPLAWYGTHRWIEDFAYRTTISWWIYALSGLIMLVIALLTLSIQAVRAASANPVESLRAE